MEDSSIIIKGDNKYAILGMRRAIQNIKLEKPLLHTLAVYFFDDEVKNIDSNFAILNLSFSPIVIVCSERLHNILRKLPTTMNKLFISLRDSVESIIESISNYISKFSNVISIVSLKDYKKWCSTCLEISAGELIFIKLFMKGSNLSDISSITKLSWQRIYAIKKNIKRKTGARTDNELYIILNSISLYISMLNTKIVSTDELEAWGAYNE